MSTETDVVNIALRRIGAARINDLQRDQGNDAKAARDIYPEAVRDMLAAHTWNFATKRAHRQSTVSDNVVAAPAFGYDFAYVVPDDFLRMISVHPSDSDESTIEYRLEFQEDGDRVLLCNGTDIYLKYIFNLNDPSVMSPAFIDALAWRLARDLAMALSKSASAAELAENNYRRALARAKSIEGVEDFPDTMAIGTWAKSRMGRYDPGRD